MEEDKRSYREKLLDPRWQKKRLEILQRDRWACRHCGATAETLEIHHLSYRPHTAPWDNPDDYYQTLCAPCHRQETERVKVIRACITNMLHMVPWNAECLDLLLHVLIGIFEQHRSLEARRQVLQELFDRFPDWDTLNARGEAS